MHTCRPSSQAFFATRPAPSMTLGFDVLVQLVIAAITTLPCLSSAGCPWNENFATLSCVSLGTAKPCNRLRHLGRGLENQCFLQSACSQEIYNMILIICLGYKPSSHFIHIDVKYNSILFLEAHEEKVHVHMHSCIVAHRRRRREKKTVRSRNEGIGFMVGLQHC